MKVPEFLRLSWRLLRLIVHFLAGMLITGFLAGTRLLGLEKPDLPPYRAVVATARVPAVGPAPAGER